MLASQISVADAHTPGPMTLDYNTSTDILTVTVTHVTADVNTHYIYEIVIEKNSVQIDIQTYTSQSSASQVVETFTVTAVDGDILKATAKCSVSGQVSNQITVTDPATTSSSTTATTSGTLDNTTMTLLIGGSIVAIGIVLVVVIVIKRR
ncbi:MAG: hypothetical protein IH631_01225 [Candidatus Thorarchaeota archaeon]|nr:hypothetical protein [Candidatus Thorarchaeota archaeon]